jgi:PqqD family protein of HPr-rel-A system
VEELDGEAVVFDEEHGAFHHLNSTAALVFGLCDGTATMPHLAADLSLAFGVPATDVEPQVRALVGRFRRANLLTAPVRRPASEGA